MLQEKVHECEIKHKKEVSLIESEKRQLFDKVQSLELSLSKERMLHRIEAEKLQAKITDLETHESDLNTQVSTLNITLKEKDVMIDKLQDRLENMKDELTGGPWSVISKSVFRITHETNIAKLTSN